MEEKTAWQRADPMARRAISAAWDCGMPPAASALHARWWQLETWLRSLVYVEQSALSGQRWPEVLKPGAHSRSAKEQASSYMASPDAQAALAFLDVTPLFDLLTEDWDRYEHALIDRPAWEGRATELIRIRHRIGHCRRPHPDDLGRLEQTLRDLEGGAFRTIAAYNRTEIPSTKLADPLVAAWGRGRDRENTGLVEHAQRQYEVGFQLAYSQRPWAEPYEDGQIISGRAGYLWHVTFVMRGGVPVDLRKVWADSYLDAVRERMVYLTTDLPFRVEVTFPAVVDAGDLAETIRWLFESVLTNRGYRLEPDPFDENDLWVASHRELDPRVQVATAWALLDDTTVPFTIFGA